MLLLTYLKKSNEKFHDSCLIKTIKHPPSVMVWPVISGKGTGRLYVVNGMMRQDQYKEVLTNQLLPQLNDWFQEDDQPIFMQDSAPCHTAKSIKNFLREKNVPLLEWPGNSPEMNPIENVWECLKREIGKDNVTNKTVLIYRIIYHWHHNPQIKEIAESCIDSISRIAALIAAKGSTTKY